MSERCFEGSVRGVVAQNLLDVVRWGSRRDPGQDGSVRSGARPGRAAGRSAPLAQPRLGAGRGPTGRGPTGRGCLRHTHGGPGFDVGRRTKTNIEVVGAVGDLARSMVLERSGCHQQSTRVIVCGRRALGDLIARLADVGLDVGRVTTLAVSPEKPPSAGEARLSGPVKNASDGLSPRARDE